MSTATRILITWTTTSLAVLLLAPQCLAGILEVDSHGTLRFTGGAQDADNLTLGDRDGTVWALEDGARLSGGPSCAVGTDPYTAVCRAPAIDRLVIDLGGLGSDLHLLTHLPAVVHGSPDDDVIFAGPGEETIDPGAGADVVAIAGTGHHVVHAGSGANVISYAWQLDAHEHLVPRTTGVRIVLDKPNASGGPGQHDTLLGHYSEIDGSNGDDHIDVRDGTPQTVVCGTGHSSVQIDPFDTPTMTCRTAHAAAAPGTEPMRSVPLPFPFAAPARARSAIIVDQPLPLNRGSLLVRVACPVPAGLLDIFGPGCRGRLALLENRILLTARRLVLPRGGVLAWRVRLPAALRALAARPTGLALQAIGTATDGATRLTSFIIHAPATAPH